jgi:hypothetical protein
VLGGAALASMIARETRMDVRHMSTSDWRVASCVAARRGVRFSLSLA